jgi:hypothetical protein
MGMGHVAKILGKNPALFSKFRDPIDAGTVLKGLNH